MNTPNDGLGGNDSTVSRPPPRLPAGVDGRHLGPVLTSILWRLARVEDRIEQLESHGDPVGRTTPAAGVAASMVARSSPLPPATPLPSPAASSLPGPAAAANTNRVAPSGVPSIGDAESSGRTESPVEATPRGRLTTEAERPISPLQLLGGPPTSAENQMSRAESIPALLGGRPELHSAAAGEEAAGEPDARTAFNAAKAALEPADRPRGVPGAGGKAEPFAAVDFEALVGGRWFAIAGAVIISIGLGLFFKLAYDAGWIGSIPPAARCFMGAVLGVALIVVGELARRRWNAWASVGLSSAGIAALFLSTFAAHAVFDLMGPTRAFSLLLVVAGVGVGISVRSGIATVGIVGLLGGYLSPLLVRSEAVSPVVLPTLLTVLLATGLVIAGWKRGTFLYVGSFAWAMSMLMGTVWLIGEHAESPLIALLFIGAMWSMSHGAAAAITRRAHWRGAAAGEGRGSEVTGTRGDPTDDNSVGSPAGQPATGLRGARLSVEAIAGLATAQPTLAPAALGVMLVLSLSSTAWAAVAGFFTLSSGTTMAAWLATAALCGATGLLAAAMWPDLSILTRRPHTDAERLGAGLACQSAGLLIATIALALSGVASSITWLVMGVAAIAGAALARSRPLSAYGLLLMGLGTVKLCSYDLFWLNLSQGTRLDYLGIVPSAWMLLAAIAGSAWIAAGKASVWWSAGPDRRAIAEISTVVAAVLLAAAGVHPQAGLQGTALVWLVSIAALALLDRWDTRLGGSRIAFASSCAAAALWLGVFLLMLLSENFDWRQTSPETLLHPGVIAGLVVTAMPLIAAGMARPFQAGGLRRGVMVATGTAFAAITAEVARTTALSANDTTTQLAAVSIWWALASVGALAMGFRWRMPVLRQCALVLMGTTAVKVVLIDMANVPAVWRVVTFVLLGLLMVGVSVAYSRLARAISGPDQPPPPGETEQRGNEVAPREGPDRGTGSGLA